MLTAPMPSMLTSVAPVVCQVRVVDSPALMVLGFAASEAVGGCAVGGAGGGGGGNFFAHAPRNMIVASANRSRLHRAIVVVILVLMLVVIACFTDSSFLCARIARANCSFTICSLTTGRTPDQPQKRASNSPWSKSKSSVSA